MANRKKLIEETGLPFYLVQEEGRRNEGIPKSNEVDPPYTGRIIMSHVIESDSDQYFSSLDSLDDIKKILNKNDILWVPLYKSRIGRPRNFPPPKVREYDERIAFLKEVAPMVRGILTGNQGPELSYRGVEKNGHANIKAMRKFIRMTAPIIRNAGGTPFYSPMDIDLIQDCYQCGMGLMHELKLQGATAIIFCGYTMLPGAYCISNATSQALYTESRRVMQKARGGKSPELLKNYLSRGPIWSDVEGDEGLKAGNGKLIAEWGFKAGIIGG